MLRQELVLFHRCAGIHCGIIFDQASAPTNIRDVGAGHAANLPAVPETMHPNLGAYLHEILCISAVYVGGPTCSPFALMCLTWKSCVDESEQRVRAWNSDNLPICRRSR